MTEDSGATEMVHDNGNHARGRPRDHDADARILKAAAEILSEVGTEGFSMSAVVARADVARATLYRRWPSREALIHAALSQVKGREPYRLSGDLEADLARAVEQTRTVFAEPQFQAFLPVLVRDLLNDRPETGVSATYDSVAPNRIRISEEYERLAESSGLRTDVDAGIIGNIIVGGLLTKLLSTGRTPTRKDGEKLLDVLMNGLRNRD